MIPLSPPALDVIQQLHCVGAPDLVFTTTGTTPVSGWSRAKRTLDAKIAELNGAPLPAWRTHDLRRTVATGLQRLGVGLQVVEAVLGHVSGSRAGIVGVYQRHGYDEEKRAALDYWANRVESVVHGGATNVVSLRS